MTDDASPIQRRIGLCSIRLSAAGLHTRYMLAGYLRNVGMVTSVLLAIALTIDLWPQFHLIAGEGRGVLTTIWHVLRFSTLRVPDLVAPFLPFATFLGVLGTEVVHTRSGERMLVWNSGRSPIRCLTPVILLGVLLGGVEFTIDAYLGPAAMAVQMEERLGLDGQRLDRTRVKDSHWIATSDGLLNTEIEYGPPPVLHHLTIYKLDAHGTLTEVDVADVAHQQPGSDLWLMRDGRSWSSSDAGRALGGAAQPTAELQNAVGEMMTPFAEKIIRLDIDPLWLSVFGMEPQYLRMPVLRALARSDSGPLYGGLYRTRLQALYGETLLPGAMALLATSLSLLLLAYDTPARAVVGILFAGYLAHSVTKACLLMGQNGYMPPLMAGWLVPVALLAGTVATFGVIERQRRVA
jgi:lipopolysaccharide export system permease protein